MTLPDSVRITEQLARRPERAPDHQRESTALRALLAVAGGDVRRVLREVTRVAVEVYGAGSAGIALPEGGDLVRWAAVAGGLHAHEGLAVACHESPCGAFLDGGGAELLAHPERAFPALAALGTPLVEWLAVPILGRGRVVGTLWLASHDAGRPFDAADVRRAEELAAVAGRVLARRSQATDATEQPFWRFYQSNIVGVAFCEADVVLEANDALLGMIGHTRDELPIRGWGDRVVPEDRHRDTAGIEEIRTTGTCPPYEKGHRRPDGTVATLLIGGARIAEEPLRWVAFAVDVSAQRRVQDALRASERKFRRVVDSNFIGIAFWDETGAVTDANEAFLDMLGRTRADLAAGAVDWRRLVVPEHLAILERAVEETRLTGVSSRFEAVLLHANGARVPIASAGAGLGDAPLRGVNWLVDMTERVRVETEREALLTATLRARAEAEAASRAKDEFLAMLGHELRNPLSAVRNAVVTARLDPSRRDRALDIARRQADQLGRLIDDLLDTARITQGRIALRRERVPFRSLVQRAVETTRSFVEERAHALAVTLPVDDVLVDGDPTRLEQIVVNLLNNAAKYTPPGGRIEVVAEQRGEEIFLRVRDDGVGIAPAVLPRIFDLFAQGDRTPDRSQGGLGIGLTVVRRLVELHGGRIEARSAGIGKGSEFVVTLPVVPPAPALPGPAPEPAPTTRRARVLVVEDNPDAAESLTMLLELFGHHVRVVYDGLAALDAARESVPEVMLVDIGLPGMDGYEVARCVRADDTLRGVFLVALTGYGRDEDRRQAVDAGFDYHLVKPVDVDALERLVGGLVTSDARTRPPASAAR